MVVIVAVVSDLVLIVPTVIPPLPVFIVLFCVKINPDIIRPPIVILPDVSNVINFAPRPITSPLPAFIELF